MSYNPALVLNWGTAACGVGVLLERRRRMEIEELKRRLAARPEPPPDVDDGSLADHRRFEQLRDNVRIIGIDVDGSGGYAVHPALTADIDQWAAGAFRHLNLPGPDLRTHQLSGRIEGFEAINPHALESIDQLENAAGGVRNLGWLAARTARKELQDVILQALNAFGRLRRERHREGDTVRVRNIVGAFGGFGSGALEFAEDLVLECLDQTFASPQAWDLQTILLVPARFRGKDPDNTWAVTAAVFLERAATGTGALQRVVRTASGTRLESRRGVPLTLMSDENAAEAPSVLTPENFAGAVAEFAWSEVASDLGEKLIARSSDLETAGAERTHLGEPLRARAAGVSTVELPVDRIRRYCEARLGAAVLGLLLQEVDETQIDDLSKSFFKQESLLEGDGFSDLSQELLRVGPDGPAVDAVLRERFRRASRDLEGLNLLLSGGDRINLVMRQLTPDKLIADREDNLSGRLDARMETEVQRLFRDPQKGAAAARQFLELTAARAEHVAQKAGEENTERQGRLRETEARVAHFENQYTPAVQRMNFIVRFIKRRQINSAAALYRAALEQRAAATTTLSAGQAAVRVLEAAREVADRLLIQVSKATDTLAEIRTALTDDQRRVAELPVGTTCPIGLSLVRGEDDLDAYYRRFLHERGEDGALRDVAARLLAEQDIVANASAVSGIQNILATHVAATFRASLSELHVADELVRRFPAEADLSEVLRERADREARERITYKDGTTDLYGERIVQVVGLDRARGAQLVTLLEQQPDADAMPYEVVDTADRQRIVFLRVRGAVPLSAWSHLGDYRKSYERVSEQSPYERLHVVPGDRFYPWPDERLTRGDAGVIVLKAWILGRLALEAGSSTLTIMRGRRCEMAIDETGRIRCHFEAATQECLGSNLQTLTTPEDHGRRAYDIAVDVVSAFNRAIQLFGTAPIDAALSALQSVNTKSSKSLDSVVARLATEEGTARLRHELKHWRHNTQAPSHTDVPGLRVIRGVA